MSAASDLVILGGGPAGCAAGIWACQRGLSAVLLETPGGPRNGAGETLHPGSSVVLRQLGVLDQVEAVSTIRPAAQTVIWGEEVRAHDYGSDANGPWRAYQILRSDLNRIMLARFESLGGRVVRSAARPQPIREGEVVRGLRTPEFTIEGEYTIDATGAAGVLRRALGIREFQLSPRLFAHYGYRQGVVPTEPTLAGDAAGWSWTAQITPDTVCWVRLDFRPSKGRLLSAPERVSHLPELGTPGAVEVTWRIAETVAGPGFFLAGDAAAVLDPAASHGVLRALMSGMMAAYGAAQVRSGAVNPDAAATAYTRWITAWVQRDASILRDQYARIGVKWAYPATSESEHQTPSRGFTYV